MTPVTDPALIKQLDAAFAAQQPPNVVTDPSLIKQLDAAFAANSKPSLVPDPVATARAGARDAGYFTPQPGERWDVGGTQYEVAPSGQVMSRTAAGLSTGAEFGDQQHVGEFAPATESPEELEKLALTNLPGMRYVGPEGAGLGERIATAGKQVLLDALTTDQHKQADFLVSNFTPDRNYTFVPLDDKRVMLVHRDPKTGKITRQLVTANGLSVGDVVNAAPQAAAALATGGLTGSLGAATRIGAQALASGAVAGGSEAALKAAGSERDVDWNRILIESAMGAGGEALATSVSKLAATNSAVRNFIEDTLLGRGAPQMTQELTDTLARANIDPTAFRSMTADMQKRIVRPIQAAEESAHQTPHLLSARELDEVRETARNTVDADAAGVAINAFEATPNIETKARFGSMLRGDVSEGAQAAAQNLKNISERSFEDANRRGLADLVNDGGGYMHRDATDAMQYAGVSATMARDAAKGEAQALQQAAKDRFPVFKSDLQPQAIVDLQLALGDVINKRQLTADSGKATTRILERIRDWRRGTVEPAPGANKAPDVSLENLRSELTALRGEAQRGTPDRAHADDIVTAFDGWLDRVERTPTLQRKPVTNNLAAARSAREQYAEYVANFVADRPNRVGDTAGSEMKRFIKGMSESPERTIQRYIGREDGPITGPSLDNLNRLTEHMERHLGLGHRNTPGTIPAGSASEEQLAWNALQQAVWHRAVRRPKNFSNEHASGSASFDRLFEPAEQDLIRRLARTREIVDSATRETREAGINTRSPTAKATLDFTKYLFKYRAVRDLHKFGAATAAAQALAGLAARRGFLGLEQAVFTLTMRRARDPMAAVSNITRRANKTERFTANELIDAVREAYGDHPDAETELTKLRSALTR
jgi:hypothetical protein